MGATKKSKVVETSPGTIGLMMDLVRTEYPSINSYEEYANVISAEFGVSVTPDDIIDANILGIEMEDRRLIYKHVT